MRPLPATSQPEFKSLWFGVNIFLMGIAVILHLWLPAGIFAAGAIYSLKFL